jgi:hypothetical protein
MGTDFSNERQVEAAAASAASATPSVTGEENTGSATCQAASISDEENFKVRCLSSALYHEDRERFFAWLHRSAMFLVVLSGTAALSPLKGHFPIALPAITTLLGLLDLVFDLSGKARLHATLRRQVYAVLADVGHETLPDLERKLTLIYADEPPCMYAVNAVAYNRAMTSYGRPQEFLLQVGWKSTFLRHLWPFTPSSFRANDEVPHG